MKPLESCFEHRVSKDNHLIFIIPLQFDALTLEKNVYMIFMGESSLLAEIFYVIPSIAATALLLIVKPLESCFEHRVSKDNHLICIAPLRFDVPKLEKNLYMIFMGEDSLLAEIFMTFLPLQPQRFCLL